jgi:hypothetical protein
MDPTILKCVPILNVPSLRLRSRVLTETPILSDVLAVESQGLFLMVFIDQSSLLELFSDAVHGHE